MSNIRTIPGKGFCFTLIELLLVIAIIAILASILLPTIQQARKKSREIKCVANLKSIGQGLMLYCADHNDILPFHGEWEACEWDVDIIPYLGNAKDCSHCAVYLCPEYRETAVAQGWNPDSAGNAWRIHALYANNAQLALYKITKVKKTSQVGMIFDASFLGGNHAATRPTYTQVGWRHSQRAANFLFVDGHTVTYPDRRTSDPIITIFNL